MEAALRGLIVYLPVDLMSAELLYAEQYAVWHLTHAPVFSPRVTLTSDERFKRPGHKTVGWRRCAA